MEIIILSAVLILLAEVSYLLISQKKQTIAKQTDPVFVDTSVLIDGRILDIASSGFLRGVIFLPRSVIGELQLLADSSDGEKRTKARHGLDVAAQLQTVSAANVKLFRDDPHTPEGVDRRLLFLAKKHSGTICTIDYNLAKVAEVEGISVLNVNELARNLRMNHLPGEILKLALTTTGNDKSQAVGHLDDGTMVVVEQAKSKIGKTVQIEVVRNLQTAAGKMMFAKLLDSNKSAAKKSNESKLATSIKSSPKSKNKPSGSAASRSQAPKKPRKNKSDSETRIINLVNRQ